MKIKTCGLWRSKDIEYANILQPDFVGFVFAPSKRQVDVTKARELKSNLLSHIKVVGVFVEESQDFILELATTGVIDCIQLHGKHNIKDLKIALVQALSQQSLQDNQFLIIEARKAETLDCILAPSDADFLLFDSVRSGSGLSFDWGLLEKARELGFSKDFFLAGGINVHNLCKAMSLRPYAIDVSSGIESDGVKDFAKMQALISRAHSFVL